MATIAAPSQAADYYVATNGNNSNSGTLNSPLKTIQAAADLMIPGDRCLIRGGTYREKVTVVKNNLAFEGYNGEYVVISGADLVTGWSQHSGNIYKASFSGFEPQFTQVFHAGAPQQMARYPDNVTGDMLSIEDDSGYAACEVKSGGQVTFDAALPGGANHWAGGYFRAISGKTWANPTGIITASNGANLTCTTVTTLWQQNSTTTLGPGKGYIFHLNALSRAGEWYHQNGQLYFWKSGGGAPSDTEVEAQRRELAFEIDGNNGLTLKNLNVKSASVRINNSDNCLVESCNFRFIKGWFTRPNYAVSYTELGGVYVNGDNNIFTKCYFAGSWGSQLVIENGLDNSVTNCIFENSGWMGMFTSCIQNASYNLLVDQCTFGSTGRFHIRTDVKTNITRNDFYDCMKMGQDAGSIEITNGGQTAPRHLDGAEIAYNKFHDMDTLNSYVSNKRFVVALYLEGCDDYTVHHNLVYNFNNERGDGAFCYLGPREVAIKDCYYYNNTVWNVDDRIRIWNRNASGSVERVSFINNLFDSRMEDRGAENLPNLFLDLTLRNNVSSDNAAALFVDAANGDFGLKNGSLAIDQGETIPGITNGYQGAAPDAGCFEKGNAKWTCGATIAIPPEGAVQTAPSNLAAVGGDGQVSLSWNAAPGAETYQIRRSSTAGGPYALIQGGLTSTGYVDTSVTNGSTYYYVARAWSAADGNSSDSPEASATPAQASQAPAAPTNLAAVAGNGQVSLSWTPSPGASSHQVRRSLTPGGPYSTLAAGLPSDASSYVDTAVANGTTYYYVVRCWNPNGNSPFSDEASATPQAASAWQSQDIGSVAAAGSAAYVSPNYNVSGSGSDIWGTADAFHYLYQNASGDCSIVARVFSVDNTNNWAKAGVMIRESLGADSKHASVFVTPSKGVAFQRRTSAGGSSATTTQSGFAAPYWVRITRSGDTFTAERSPDGNAWTTIGSQTISMGANVTIGIAVTSHNNGVLCAANIRNLAVVP